MDAAVRISGLSQGYGNTTVIPNLDLEINGGVFGLLGPKGAGHTTLPRTLATITPPRAGTPVSTVAR